LTDRHEIWQDDAFLLLAPYRLLKFRIFNNPRWRIAAILKIKKLPYLSHGLMIALKFGTMVHTDPLHCISRRNFEFIKSKMADGCHLDNDDSIYCPSVP